MSWEHEIIEKIDELENAVVRFDVNQQLSETEKLTAKTNIGFHATSTQVSGDNYKIVLPG